MASWVVTVTNGAGAHRYWVEAADQKDAEARGYRLHCASANFKANGKDRITESKAVG